jgi:hypothetical protein
MRRCRSCSRDLPATEYDLRSEDLCLMCRGLVPAQPLGHAIEYVAARANWTLESVCADAGIDKGRCERWSTGEVVNVPIRVADDVLDGIDRLWFDVYTEKTVRCPFALARCADLFDGLWLQQRKAA